MRQSFNSNFMKTLIFVLSLAFAARAHAQTVEVISATEVHVDGRNYGAVADAIANNKQLAPAIQRALVAYCDSQAEKLKAAETKASDAEKKTDDLHVAQAGLVQRAKPALDEWDRGTLYAIIQEAEMPEVEKQKAALDAQIKSLTEAKAKLESQ